MNSNEREGDTAKQSSQRGDRGELQHQQHNNREYMCMGPICVVVPQWYMLCVMYLLWCEWMNVCEWSSLLPTGFSLQQAKFI